MHTVKSRQRMAHAKEPSLLEKALDWILLYGMCINEKGSDHPRAYGSISFTFPAGYDYMVSAK